ncbi:hypothetical protein Bpfe_012524 [Biomphalaria pfeifferi]|uniref:Uncharacterized protein n=1 Tax=Biomphalaria pfeifferi TaxID=112525 RepID=A0AAD8BP05_BIOPF|nr:hypothetical protein Bpfe_012524 [Biomphalaria pfeifferi]
MVSADQKINWDYTFDSPKLRAVRDPTKFGLRTILLDHKSLISPDLHKNVSLSSALPSSLVFERGECGLDQASRIKLLLKKSIVTKRVNKIVP